MKILVISDTHGFEYETEEILKKERNSDIIIHLGDGGADLLEMKEYTAFKPVYNIKGNCDTSAYNFPLRLISYFDSIKFYACHGHTHNVKTNLMALYFAAKEQDCRIALFGHTHVQFKDEYDGIHLFNPGCAANGKYGIMTVTENGFELEHRSLFDAPDEK